MEAFPNPSDFRFNFAISEANQESPLQVWLSSVAPDQRARMIVNPTKEESAKLEELKNLFALKTPPRQTYPMRDDDKSSLNEPRAADPVTELFSEPDPETKKPNKNRGGRSRGDAAKRPRSGDAGGKS
jgi:hypothetical protein